MRLRLAPRVVWVGVGGVPAAIFAIFVDFDGGRLGDAGWKGGGIVDFDGGAVGDVVVNPFGVTGGESDAAGGGAGAEFVVF